MASPSENLRISLSADIEKFLLENSLPTESDILDYSKYLTIKYAKNAKVNKNEITETVIKHIKERLNRKRIAEEINKFFTKHPDPKKTDIENFIIYIKLLGLNFREEHIRSQIEEVRLYRKFKVPSKKPDQFIQQEDQFIQQEVITGEDDHKERTESKINFEDDPADFQKRLSRLARLITPSKLTTNNILEALDFKQLVRYN